jgi:polyribonucleotide nucleotidyltransferase
MEKERNKMESKKFETQFNGRKLTVEIGKLANQANGSVTVQYGETVVLATAVMSDEPRENVGFFPLYVDYEERLYAAGKIKGSRFIKREGRPTDEAVLTSRLIDRTIRPLFNQSARNEIQIIITVLSVDGENDPDIPAIIAASLAICVSDIPWNGPIGAVRIGKIGEEMILDPTYEEREKSKFDLVVAGAEGKINMLESSANEASEEEIIKAAEKAQEIIKKIIEFEKEIIAVAGKEKIEISILQPSEEMVQKIKSFLSSNLEEALFSDKNSNVKDGMKSLEEKLGSFLNETYSEEKEKEEAKAAAAKILEEETDKIIHKNILEKDRRADGRSLDEIRSLDCGAAILPRTHGSGLFQRGETQVLTVATLGAPSAELFLDTMEESCTKRFMHHYSFPPYSVGEIAPMRGPGRREIGHGALAEKALEAIVPNPEDFSYTIRLVSEVLSSNGSSSMASVCASSLALMDAGIPITRPVAGIAMGLMADKSGNYKILTDIQGPEDHYGDMDLKVAGTVQGITAMQMDVKIKGINLEILKEAIARAKTAREFILAEIDKTLSVPRKELSKYAPRIVTIKINPDKIRDVIGPGGKVINEIIADTGVTIDIEDDGRVLITSNDSEAAQKAIKRVQDLTKEFEVGQSFKGKVKKIADFGAFLEIWPGQEGLLHISEMAPHRVEKVRDIMKEGDMISVKIKGIDDQGRISLTANL